MGIMKALALRIIDFFRRRGLGGIVHLFCRLPRLARQVFIELSYQLEIKKDRRVIEAEISSQTQAELKFINRPKISVILPAYKPNLAWFREAVESVLGQTYSNFELCISDDASESKELHEYLQKLKSTDSRVKFVVRTTNGHICANTNSALELSSGEYVAFMDHDDVLDRRALFEVVKLINDRPGLDWIYSDEDKIDVNGLRSEKSCKGSFDIEKFYSTMYTGHLSVFKAELVGAVKGLRKGAEGAQDWDLALRIIESKSLEIQYLPKVLYHWRKHLGSTSSNPESKPYAHEASFNVLMEHFERTGQNRILINSPGPGFYNWKSSNE